MQVDVTIVGAGLGGLYLAHLIKKQGFSVKVLEKSLRPGGVIESSRYHEHLVPMGPRIFLRSRAEGLLKLASEFNVKALFHPKPLPRFLLSPKNELKKVGPQVIFNYPRLIPGILMSKRSDNEQTLHEFFKKAVGIKFCHEVLEPLCQGIWAADPHELSLDELMPGLKQRKLFKKNRQKGLVYFPEGLETLCHRLKESLQEDVLCKHEVSNFEPSVEGVTVTTNQGCFKTSFLVIATGFEQVKDVLIKSSYQMPEKLDSCTSSSVDVVTFCFDQKLKRPHGSGYLIPKICGFNTKGVLFDADLLGYDTIDMVSCFISPCHDPIEMAFSELKKVLGDLPQFNQVFYKKYRESIFKCDLGRGQALRELKKDLELQNIYLMGAYPKVGVADVLDYANDVFKKIGSST